MRNAILFVLLLVMYPAKQIGKDTQGQKADQTIENSVGMRLAILPAGSFIMGSDPGEKGRQEEEVQHTVKVSRPFRISVTEVTQKQWLGIMGFNRSQHQGDALPVEKITWNSAVEFCRRLSAREGRTYRLPTEAEWEYACRAGAEGAFGGTGHIEDMGWYEGNSGGMTHVVAGKAPNAWGLFDLHGNVAEWCADYYAPVYPDGDIVDPLGPKEGKARVVRGGSYAYFPASNRCAARSSLPDSYQVPHVGLRVVLEVAP